MEEDIKILENMNDGYTFKDCNICNNYNEKTKRCDKHKCMELQAIEHILSDYKRVLKENEELKKFHIQDNKHLDFIMKNSITVQKVKDKIEYLDKQQKQWLEDRELKASDSEIIFARNFLQELLKESEE